MLKTIFKNYSIIHTVLLLAQNKFENHIFDLQISKSCSKSKVYRSALSIDKTLGMVIKFINCTRYLEMLNTKEHLFYTFCFQRYSEQESRASWAETQRRSFTSGTFNHITLLFFFPAEFLAWKNYK